MTDRILLMGTTTFPRDRDWAEKHTRLLDEKPKEQTQLFGAPLFFDDGSLAGTGLYYEIDKGPVRRGDEIGEFHLARVEHAGKGVSSDATRFLASRPVPGVAGAFMSFDRRWFERIGGFTDAYVCGDYADADLCLKSIQAGMPPWLHDLKLWHLERQGAAARAPVYEGGSIVNRWLFSGSWGASISENLGGQMPAHPAFQAQNASWKTDLFPGRGVTARGDIADLVA